MNKTSKKDHGDINPIKLKADSTSRSTSSAMAFIDKFTNELYETSLDDMSEDDFTDDFFLTFGGYLVKLSCVFNEITRDTAKGYFGALKGYVLDRFKNVTRIVTLINSDLCTSIVASIHREITNDCSKKGIVASESSRPLYRQQLRTLCKYFIQQNTRKGYLCRALAVTNFSAVGR